MKYINKFSTNADYQAFTEGWGYVTPNICFITETKGLVFKPKINNGGGSQEPSVINANVGDVAYYTNGEIKTVAITNWNTSLGTPIGVVVIPSNILPDGKARILSLKAVDSNGNATTSHSYVNWGPFGTDTTLTNYIKVPNTDNTSSTSSSSNSYGFLPSDNFTGSTSFVDSSAKYDVTSDLIPSPYNGNEFNTDYSKEITGNNALSDFNGLSNTQVLVGLGSKYIAANAAYNYNDGVSNTQWYLPSAGELGFLVARFKTINNTISQLGGVAVPSDAFWSSTEYSSYGAYYINTYNGVVNKDSKEFIYMRPFALLNNNGGGTNLITFTIDGVQFQAEEGMTWEEWVNSEYNTGYSILSGLVLSYSGARVQKDNIDVLVTDILINNMSYNTVGVGGYEPQ